MPFTSLLLGVAGVVLLIALVGYGGLLESLRHVRSLGAKLTLALLTLLLLGGLTWRSFGYMNEERERWISVGVEPGDSVSRGFDTKGRFRSLAQPLGRVTDRRGELLAGYALRDGHLVRTYPAGPATAHIVGYWTGPLRDGVGVEKALTLLNDSLRDDRPHDVQLAIDLRLQRDAMKALGGKEGAIVVMDVTSGELLAAANYPTYDPSTITRDASWDAYVRDIRRRPLTSRAIKDNFSPGSSIKPLIAAAALSYGTPLPEEQGFVCDGSWVPIPRTKAITDHGSPHGRIALERAMRYSCNIYFSRLAFQDVGYEPAKDYLESLGFNERLRWNTGIFLNRYETLLPAVSWVKGRDRIAESRLGIGQASVKTNPIHFTTVVAGIANGGTFLRPSIERGRPLDTLPWRMKPSLAERLDDLLLEPLAPGGTAAGIFGSVIARGVAVHGKTGTADREPDGREPSWWISYGRKGERAYAVVVAIQNRDGKYAGSLNAPMARSIYESLLRYGYYGEGDR